MLKSLYEQLRDADNDIKSRKPDVVWDNKYGKQLKGRVVSGVVQFSLNGKQRGRKCILHKKIKGFIEFLRRK